MGGAVQINPLYGYGYSEQALVQDITIPLGSSECGGVAQKGLCKLQCVS